jgi:hypothetical protein
MKLKRFIRRKFHQCPSSKLEARCHLKLETWCHLKLGWMTGLEPATAGITIQGSTN